MREGREIAEQKAGDAEDRESRLRASREDVRAERARI